MEGALADNTNANELAEHPTNTINKNKDIQSLPNTKYLPEKVEKFIESYVRQRGYSDVTINAESGSNLGDNYTGILAKLTITGVDQNNEKATFNWIVKTAPDTEMYRVMKIENIFARETYLYKDILQIFRNFEKEKQILKPFNQYPTFIAAYEEPMVESIVMEDMKSVGYVLRPRQEPLDLCHVKLVMKTYGKLHAISYALKDQKPEVFKEIAENTRDVLVETIMNEAAKPFHAPIVTNGLTVLTSEDEKIRPRYQSFIDNYVEVLPKLLLEHNDRSVICHGDSWVNNMLWKYDASHSGIPTDVCLLDFQMTRCGSPVFDLSYFLFTCTTKEFRDKHYDDMIRLYYYTLCAHVTDLGSDPQRILTFEALKEELSKYSLFGLFAAISVLALVTTNTSDVPEWRSDDMNPETLQEQWMKSNKSNSAYNERARGVLLDFYEKGYFNSLV